MQHLGSCLHNLKSSDFSCWIVAARGSLSHMSQWIKQNTCCFAMHNPPNSSESQDCADQILQAATVVASFYHLHADNYTFYWRIAHFQHRHLRRLPSTCIIGCSHNWTVWYSLYLAMVRYCQNVWTQGFACWPLPTWITSSGKLSSFSNQTWWGWHDSFARKMDQPTWYLMIKLKWHNIPYFVLQYHDIPLMV